MVDPIVTPPPPPAATPAPLSPTIPLNPPMVGIASPFDRVDGQNRDLILEAIRAWARGPLRDWTGAWQNDLITWLDDTRNWLATWDAEVVRYVQDAMQENLDAAQAVVDAVVDNSIELQDPLLAALLTDTNTESRAAADALYSTEYSAAPHLVGGSNDAPGLQAAADIAHALGMSLYIPAGDWNLAGVVDVRTSVRSDGTLHVTTTSGGLRILRTAPKTPVDPTTVSGLVRGSTQITGAPFAGTAIIKSSEELCRRILAGAFGPPYTKQEVLHVSETGELSTPVTDTYNTALITSLDFVPEEPLLTLDGVKIRCQGEDTTALDNVLRIERSNVVVNNPDITNDYSVSHGPASAVRVQDAHNVVFNNPTISGFLAPSTGYGIAKYVSTNIVLNNPNISDCRHGVTGRHDHSVTLNGGYISGIDTHWGWNLVVNNVSVKVGVGGNVILVAGGNLTVNGGLYAGGRSLVGYRLDTPEFGGFVKVTNNPVWTPSIQPSAPDNWIVGYSSVNNNSHGGLDFGRTLDSADIYIDSVTVNMDAPMTLTAVYLGNMSFDHVLPKHIEIAGVVVNDQVTELRDVYLHASNAGKQPRGRTRIAVNGVTRPAGARGTMAIVWADNEALGFDVTLRDADNVRVQVPLGLTKLNVEGSTLVALRSDTTVTPQTIPYTIANSRIVAASFVGTWQADFINNVWEGEATSSGLALSGRPASFIGNLKTIGATAPVNEDGYRNPAYYS